MSTLTSDSVTSVVETYQQKEELGNGWILLSCGRSGDDYETSCWWKYSSFLPILSSLSLRSWREVDFNSSAKAKNRLSEIRCSGIDVSKPSLVRFELMLSLLNFVFGLPGKFYIRSNANSFHCVVQSERLAPRHDFAALYRSELVKGCYISFIYRSQPHLLRRASLIALLGP